MRFDKPSFFRILLLASIIGATLVAGFLIIYPKAFYHLLLPTEPLIDFFGSAEYCDFISLCKSFQFNAEGDYLNLTLAPVPGEDLVFTEIRLDGWSTKPRCWLDATLLPTELRSTNPRGLFLRGIGASETSKAVSVSLPCTPFKAEDVDVGTWVINYTLYSISYPSSSSAETPLKEYKLLMGRLGELRTDLEGRKRDLQREAELESWLKKDDFIDTVLRLRFFLLIFSLALGTYSLYELIKLKRPLK